jgi:DNA-binding response OmpR family regulator
MSENKKRVLVVDDDEDIADMMEMILENQGYSVNKIIRAEEVLGIKEDLPDLILLDIWMSGIDGRDICRHLKNQPLTKHIPIILISANRDVQEIATTAGANDFICKPFDMDELLEKVEKYCNL